MQRIISRCRGVAVAALASVLFLAPAGCFEKGVPVEGTVRFKGELVPGVQVQLVTDDGSPIAMGITDPSGIFRLANPKGKNSILPGTYKVTVSKRERDEKEKAYEADGRPSAEMIEMMKKKGFQYGKEKPKPEEGKALVPERFGSVVTTTLSITVPAPGPVELNLGDKD